MTSNDLLQLAFHPSDLIGGLEIDRRLQTAVIK